MSPYDRRLFLQTSLAGFASLAPLSGRGRLQASDADPEVPIGWQQPVQEADLPRFNDGDPDTLFLTWQRDPTTTITATWLGEETPEESVEIRVSPLDAEDWKAYPTKRHSYPVPGLFVYRAEAVGLKPGSQYRLRVGPGMQDLRFQTMPEKLTNTFQFVSGVPQEWWAQG